MPAIDQERIVVAEVVRPHGIRGELIVKSQTDVPGRLEQLKKAQARLASGSDIAIEVASARVHKGEWILKLVGVDSIDAAERFRGADLWVPFAERGVLPEGEYFQNELTGFTVVDAASRRRLGVIEGWQKYGGPALMQLTVDGREVLIPFVDSICKHVDLRSRTIMVDLPEGLLEL